ncbi:MAG: glycosyltransferase [Candidatus Competibacteraceae bacterium]|nr:glycosyltransferase [Candidatus Competibacteraceae bacterium]
MDEEFPYPLNTGKRIRSFNLYCRLASRFEIIYVGYGEVNSDAIKAFKLASMTPVPVSTQIPNKKGLAFYIGLFSNLFSSLPYIVSSHYSQVYQNIIDKYLREFNPDIIICEWTPYAIYVKNFKSINKIVSTHNIEADIWWRYYKNEKNSFRRWYIYEQWRKVKRFEKSALKWVDAALAVSSLDREKIIDNDPDLPVAVISNGVDLDYFYPMPQPENRSHIVFTGSMDWRPNQDAVRYFVDEIFPFLHAIRPDITCSFVGRDPPADIKALGRLPGIHITGTVDDVRTYVERSAVYIVPLRIGGGSRLKILEALAMKRAVVSTTIGAEGLHVSHGQNILLADDPYVFAQFILQLLEDKPRCLNLATEGRHLVEQYYGWDALANQLGDFIQKVGSSSLR